jgi:hypothetical protein
MREIVVISPDTCGNSKKKALASRDRPGGQGGQGKFSKGGNIGIGTPPASDNSWVQ